MKLYQWPNERAIVVGSSLRGQMAKAETLRNRGHMAQMPVAFDFIRNRGTSFSEFELGSNMHQALGIYIFDSLCCFPNSRAAIPL